MSSKRLFWNIVEQIEASIKKGEYSPGSRLPAERELAEKFEVSRPTIREAIIALEVRGSVEVKTNSGVFVMKNTQEAITTDSINAFELTQARALIEGEVASMAATSITDEQLGELEQTLIEMENPKNVEEADQKFHKIISKAAKNNAMQGVIEYLWSVRIQTQLHTQSYKQVCQNETEQVLKEHADIVQALKARDPQRARSAMHQHFNRLINSLFDAEEARSLAEIKRKNDEKRGLYSIDSLIGNR